MGNVMAYSGLTTKIRAMQAKLLTQADYETISGFTDVVQVVEFLKTKPAYAVYMDQLELAHLHRGDIEKMLYQSLYNDYTRIFRFAGIDQKKFLKIYWKKYEVSVINYCLRIVFNHYDKPYDLDYKKKFLKIYWKKYEVSVINYCLRIVFNHYDKPYDLDYKKEFFDKYSKLSIDKLITSTNIDELVDNLRGSEYYEALKPIRDSGAATLFDYDQALELYYFTNYWRRGRKVFSGKSRERFSRDVGIKMDLMNIQWAYRAKQYYRMLPAEIYALTLPYHFHLSTEEFKAIVEAPNVEEMKKQIENTYYGTHVHMKEGQFIEKSIKDILRDLYISDRQKDPYSDATMHAFLFLKEQEIDKLTTALECIRYGLTRQEILTYLGGESK